MPTVHAIRTYDAPIDQVFAAFCDLEHAEENIPDIKQVEILEGGRPFSVGTRWRETRTVMGKEATEEMEVAELEENQRYLVTCDSHGTHYETEFRFTPEGDGKTRVEVDFSGKAESLGARVMSPLGFLFKGVMRQCLEKDMEAIASVVEGQSAAEPTSG